MTGSSRYGAFAFVVKKARGSHRGENDRERGPLAEYGRGCVDRSDFPGLVGQELDEVQGRPVAMKGVLTCATGVEVGTGPEG